MTCVNELGRGEEGRALVSCTMYLFAAQSPPSTFQHGCTYAPNSVFVRALAQVRHERGADDGRAAPRCERAPVDGAHVLRPEDIREVRGQDGEQAAVEGHDSHDAAVEQHLRARVGRDNTRGGDLAEAPSMATCAEADSQEDRKTAKDVQAVPYPAVLPVTHSSKVHSKITTTTTAASTTNYSCGAKPLTSGMASWDVATAAVSEGTARQMGTPSPNSRYVRFRPM